MLFLFASFATIHAQEIDYVKISEKFIKSAKFKDDNTPYYIKVIAEADKKELKKLLTRGEEKGLTIIPLALFISDRGFAKLEIGLAQGKKTFDKRDTMKERDTKIEMDRAMKR